MAHKYLLITIIIIFTLRRAQPCAIDTFKNTKATLTGVRGVSEITGCFEPGNNLDKVSLVQIVNESVPLLYEDSFNNLNHLVDVILENDGVAEIRPGAFRNLPQLYLIRLKHNNFPEIREGVFNHLLLSELALVGNGIETVSPRAFDDMPNLSIVLLGNNKIRAWESTWFRGSPEITVLNFENNAISRLPAGALRNVKGVHAVNNLNVSTSIHLNGNDIGVIEDGALDGPETLGWLFLQRNRIEEFGGRCLGNLRHLDWLRLDHNRLSCVSKEVAEAAPNVKYYLDGNPLTEECVSKLDIRTKTNSGVNKFHIKIN